MAQQSDDDCSDDAERFRFDLAIEKIVLDEKTRTFKASLKPDPRRYETISVDGEPAYRDKFSGVCTPQKLFLDMVSKLPGLPIFHLQRSVENADAYSKARLDAVRIELETGHHVLPTEKPKPQGSLSPSSQNQPMTFISVDICGSTSLRKQDQQAFDKSNRIMFQELGTAVGQFQGAIFKQTGDGFIAFLEHPSVNSQCDAAVDLGLTMLHLMNCSINPALRERKLPELHIRVGIEHGTATIQKSEIPATGFSAVEIASDALNRCVKVQESCNPDELRIGECIRDLLHVQWLERTQIAEVDLAPNIGLKNFRVYTVS